VPEPSTVEVIPSEDGRLPQSLSIDGRRHPVASIVRQWQTGSDDCFEVELANQSSAILYRDRWSGGWTVVEVRGRSRLA
jgi:hypothetical protein